MLFLIKKKEMVEIMLELEEIINEFVKRVYDTSVEDTLEIYKEHFNITRSDKMTESRREFLKMYSSFTKDQKKIFFDLLKIVIIDSISQIFGIIDGSSYLIGGNMEIEMSIEGKNTEGMLQDYFLSLVEEKEE